MPVRLLGFGLSAGNWECRVEEQWGIFIRTLVLSDEEFKPLLDVYLSLWRRSSLRGLTAVNGRVREAEQEKTERWKSTVRVTVDCLILASVWSVTSIPPNLKTQFKHCTKHAHGPFDHTVQYASPNISIVQYPHSVHIVCMNIYVNRSLFAHYIHKNEILEII